tara:strand:- start:5936 stop:6214 length:279 start_codon:yes stop_codon:yes gene_type:complete
MMYYVLLFIAIFLNFFFIWYVRQLLVRFNYFSEIFEMYFDSLQKFEEHLESVYELETFYGDTTLQGLLQHTKDITDLTNEIRSNFEIEKEES